MTNKEPSRYSVCPGNLTHGLTMEPSVNPTVEPLTSSPSPTRSPSITIVPLPLYLRVPP